MNTGEGYPCSFPSLWHGSKAGKQVLQQQSVWFYQWSLLRNHAVPFNLRLCEKHRRGHPPTLPTVTQTTDSPGSARRTRVRTSKARILMFESLAASAGCDAVTTSKSAEAHAGEWFNTDSEELSGTIVKTSSQIVGLLLFQHKRAHSCVLHDHYRGRRISLTQNHTQLNMNLKWVSRE